MYELPYFTMCLVHRYLRKNSQIILLARLTSPIEAETIYIYTLEMFAATRNIYIPK